MTVPHLPFALDRLELALSDVPVGPVRDDLAHALAIARFDADGAGDVAPLDVHFGDVPAVPAGPMFPALEASPLADALDEVQRALIWEADTASFTDANLNSAAYLRAAGYVDRAARQLKLAAPAAS